MIEEGFPPVRLTDEQSDQRLQARPRPQPPSWTASFRLAVLEPPDNLLLPTATALPPAP